MADYQCQLFTDIPTTGCVDGYYSLAGQYFDIRCSSALVGSYSSSSVRQDIYDCSFYCSALNNCIGANFDPADNSCQIHTIYQGFSDTPIPAVLVLTTNPCPSQTTSTSSSTTTQSTTTSTSTSDSTTSTSTSESTTTSSTTSESTTTSTTSSESTTSTTETTSETTTSETTSEIYTTTFWTTTETNTEPSTTTWTTWTTPVLDCTPWTKEEECDDESGGTYTKTHTIYPTGCQSEDKPSTWEHWKSTTTEWETWPTTTQSTNSWITWSKPTPSTAQWDDWYTTVTVITTKYVDVCSTGYVTVPYTKTITWSHPQATTTDYVWPTDKDGCPSGFTTTTSVCAYGCGKPWATVTVTIPVKDEASNVDNWAWLTKTVEATSAWSKTTAAEVKATNTENWNSWNAEPSNKVKVWTGAASSNVVGGLSVVVGGIIAGFFLL